jgi:hypothetical protein
MAQESEEGSSATITRPLGSARPACFPQPSREIVKHRMDSMNMINSYQAYEAEAARNERGRRAKKYSDLALCLRKPVRPFSIAFLPSGQKQPRPERRRGSYTMLLTKRNRRKSKQIWSCEGDTNFGLVLRVTRTPSRIPSSNADG